MAGRERVENSHAPARYLATLCDSARLSTNRSLAAVSQVEPPVVSEVEPPVVSEVEPPDSCP